MNEKINGVPDAFFLAVEYLDQVPYDADHDRARVAACLYIASAMRDSAIQDVNLYKYPDVVGVSMDDIDEQIDFVLEHLNYRIIYETVYDYAKDVGDVNLDFLEAATAAAGVAIAGLGESRSER